MKSLLSFRVLQGFAFLMASQVWRGVVVVKGETVFKTAIDSDDWDSTASKPWSAEGGVSHQNHHKDPANLCSGSTHPGKGGGGLLKRLVDRPFKSRMETFENSELMLVPWIEPFPESPSLVNLERKFNHMTLGKNLIGPSKRGWELVDMCQCCYEHQNSPCCEFCQRSSGRISNRPRHIPKERKPKPKSDRKHVKNFIQTTMCLCCNRAHVDTCCELCQKVEPLWCC